jgi:hypothetical protein
VLTVLLVFITQQTELQAVEDLAEPQALPAQELPQGHQLVVHMAVAVAVLNSPTKMVLVAMEQFVLFGDLVEHSRQLILEIYNE